MRLKSITVPRGYDGLHIEVDGVLINIMTGLRNIDGQKVTTIRVNPDQYAGDPQWKAFVSTDQYKEVETDGCGIRVVCANKEE